MAMTEEWRSIKGYEGAYEVSDLGRVRSIERWDSNGNRKYPSTMLKLGFYGNYKVASLSKFGKSKTIRVHRLVMMAFSKEYHTGYGIVIDHINCDKADNRFTNLQWLPSRTNTSKDIVRDKPTGVYVSGNKFTASIRIEGKQKYLGVFKTEKEASIAYKQELLVFGEG